MKHTPQKSSVMQVEDPVVAALLADPARARHLAPFIGQERTLSEAARQLEIRPSALLYHLQRLIEHGLLEVTRTETRGGRPSKIYRSTHSEFFLPFSATTASTLETFFHHWSDPWHNLFLRALTRAMLDLSPSWGVRIARDGTGPLIVEPSSGPGQRLNLNAPDAPLVRLGWNTSIWLEREDARSLQRDLAELGARYMGRGGRQRYLLRLAMVPLLEEAVVLDH
jgi:DNA-binding transcriptional ArsR family regulator